MQKDIEFDTLQIKQVLVPDPQDLKPSEFIQIVSKDFNAGNRTAHTNLEPAYTRVNEYIRKDINPIDEDFICRPTTGKLARNSMLFTLNQSHWNTRPNTT